MDLEKKADLLKRDVELSGLGRRMLQRPVVLLRPGRVGTLYELVS